MTIRFSIILFILGSIGFFSCGKQEENPTSSFYLSIPSTLGEMPISEHPITKEGIELGKMLFFDPILSENGKISCASCHFPELAFSDGKALSSAGVSQQKLIRHSPPLFNLAWHKGFFWDGGAKNLASQAFGPLTHPDEMGSNLKEITKKLKAHSTYPSLFEKAFPHQEISSQNLGIALSHYQFSLISGYSPFDDFLMGKKTLTSDEKQGLSLFMTHCESCHQSNHFSDFDYHNNGLDSTFDYPEEDQRLGRYRITLDKNDLGKYKTPSLRNSSLTAPYMHDGRFESLEQVLEHYTNDVKKSPTLDEKLSKKIILSTKEKQQIITFLHTLTDEKFIQIHSKN